MLSLAPHWEFAFDNHSSSSRKYARCPSVGSIRCRSPKQLPISALREDCMLWNPTLSNSGDLILPISLLSPKVSTLLYRTLEFEDTKKCCKQKHQRPALRLGTSKDLTLRVARISCQKSHRNSRLLLLKVYMGPERFNWKARSEELPLLWRKSWLAIQTALERALPSFRASNSPRKRKHP